MLSSEIIELSWAKFTTPTLPSLVALVIILGTLASYVFFPKSMDKSQEPPEAPSIPLLGHLIGLTRKKFNYYVELR